MFTVLCVGDLHWKKDNADVSDLVASKILNIVTEKNPQMVVLLGDILHSHERIDLGPFNRATKFIETLATKTTVVLVIGNHERPTNNTYLTEEHAFVSLKGKKNIHIADKVLSIKLKIGKSRIRFVFVPYVPVGKFHDALQELDDKIEHDPPHCIFAHQEFKGAKSGNFVSLRGDIWDEDLPLIITGHYHTFQQPQKNIIYPGTPYQMSYADNSKKGVLLCEFQVDQPPNISFLTMKILEKKQIHISADEVDDFVPPVGIDCRIVVGGKVEDIRALQASGKLDKFRGQPNLHLGLSVIAENETGSQFRRSYRELLYDNIKSQEDIVKLYEKLFPEAGISTAPAAYEGSSLESLLSQLEPPKQIEEKEIVTEQPSPKKNPIRLVRRKPMPIRINKNDKDL